MSQIRVKIFSDYASPEGHVRHLSAIYGLKDGKYHNLQLVAGDDYTHAVIFNLMSPDLKIPPENVIGFIQEPIPYNFSMEKIRNYHNEYLIKRVATYYLNNKPPFPSDIIRVHHGFLPNRVSYRHVIKPKKHIMSIIASNKAFWPGHKLRHKYVERILQTDMNIKVYGRGLENRFKDSRIMGTFHKDFEAISPYRFVIALENSVSDYYITEKLTDLILCGTIPIYLGGKYVSEIYGDKCCIPISGNIEQDIHLIRSIYHSPDKWAEEIEIEKAREIMNTTEFLPVFLIKHWTGI